MRVGCGFDEWFEVGLDVFLSGEFEGARGESEGFWLWR